jgi:outer membrane immunogenic protein
VKRILIAGAFVLAVGGQALAADLPPPVAPPPQAPATYVPTTAPLYNWSGIYLGINGGYAVTQSMWGAPPLFPTGPFSMDGFQVGGTIGANYQWGHFVLGIEGDGDWAKQSGTISRSDWLATVRGRAGYAFDRILFYATGGAAPGNRQVHLGGASPSAAPPKLVGPSAPALKELCRRTGPPRLNTSTSISVTNPALLRVAAALLVPSRLPRTSFAPASTTSSISDLR